MRRLALIPFVLVLAGCPEKKNETPPAPSATNTAVSTATDAAAAAADASTAAADAGKDSHMAHCPTAVTGATVAIKDVEGGVELSITAKDDAATKEIRDRMTKLAAADKNEADAGIKHTGTGQGRGVYGRCTIVMKNTKLETAEIPGGVKATVKAQEKSEVDWLRRETRDRDKEAKMAGSEGAGSHKMAHCPSAVEGAKTAVKDTKEGVVVTVTGPKDKVEEIQSRAKHTADIAKMATPPKVEHTSEGKGGGGLGRCPVVVEGDTTVDVKNLDNGAEITVKAKKDPAALQKEAKDRAQNFGK